MKHAPGRNQPCPCRSGRKYKHCCLRKAGAAAGPAYSRHERTETFDKISRFVMRDEFAEDRRVAQLLFWASRLDFAPEVRRRELESDEFSLAAFLNWLIF
ncbi:MAG: SEC-C domain-containing protein, partial [Gemmatimonadetes bacterium]|nr:SEC-C domain-containing protein [Gemmatimonadota bacterium]